MSYFTKDGRRKLDDLFLFLGPDGGFVRYGGPEDNGEIGVMVRPTGGRW